MAGQFSASATGCCRSAGRITTPCPGVRRRTAARCGMAPGLAFCYPVERAPLTLPVAHVQSKLAPIFTSGTEVAQNVESQENPARILP